MRVSGTVNLGAGTASLELGVGYKPAVGPERPSFFLFAALDAPLGGNGGSPCEKFVDVINRWIAIRWRGGDLNTLSSTAGQGTGASVQAANTTAP